MYVLLIGVSGVWADGLLPSTTEGANAEYQYKIFNRAASTYYLGNTTNATLSIVDYGLFAFYADTSGDYPNGYYIYSIFEEKWVTYTPADSYSGGKSKISLSSDKPSVPWNIAADDTDNKYYDIRAFKTDKTVANMSWNWYDGASNNTSNTMGFFSYTDENSGWGLVLAGGNGSPVADRKLIALYNVPKDDNLYALYNSSGTPKVSSTTGTTPQYFVLRQNGLDTNGEALYRLQKAEMDGNYLQYQNFATDGYNYMFLNTSSYFYSKFTIATTNQPEWAVSPYYNLYRVWPNATDNSSRPYSNQVAQCNDAVVNMYSGAKTAIPAQLTDKGDWNGRWKVVEQSYTAWQVVNTTSTSGGAVTYTGSNLLTGATAKQSDGGIFVIGSATTPTAGNFTPDVVDGYYSEITIDDNRKLIKIAYTDCSTEYTAITNLLTDTPETIGYPNATARTALQTAINTFDSSSRTISDYTTLTTAKATFLNTESVNLPEVGKIYTLQSYISSKTGHELAYLQNVDGTLTISETASETALNNLWIVRSSSDKIVLQSAADFTQYITYSSPGLATPGSDWTLSKGASWPYIAMYNSSLGGGRYVASDGSSEFGVIQGDVSGHKYYSQTKQQASGWSTDFMFVESTDYKFITYYLKWNGNTIATETDVLAEIGAAPVSPWTVPAYCSFTYDVATIAEETTEVNVTLNWDGPFVFSSSATDASWYYMKVGGKWAAYGADSYSEGVHNPMTTERPTGDKALWAFVGDPYNGLKIINKATGEGKYLYTQWTPLQMYTSDNSYVIWNISEQDDAFNLSNSVEGTIYMYGAGWNISESKWEDKLGYNGETTIGAMTKISVTSYYKELYLAKLEECENSIGEYFGVTQTAYDDHNATVDANAITTESYYNIAVNLLNRLSKKYPETGFYRIKNNNTGDYIGYNKPEGLTAGQKEKTYGLVAVTSANAASDASTIVKLTRVSTPSLNTGTYTISLQGLNVQGTPDADAIFTATGGDAVQYKFVVSTPGIVYIKDSNASGAGDATEGCFHESDWSTTHTLNGIVPWTGTPAKSKWTVEDASDITLPLSNIGGKGYTTAFLPFDVEEVEGAKAYTMTLNDDKDKAIMSEVTEFPIGTGVMMVSDDYTTNSTVTLQIASAGSIGAVEDNILTGHYVKQTESDKYVLANGTYGLGFYPLNGEQTVAANKAFINASSLSSGVKALSFDFGLTDGITSVDESHAADGTVYNLAGQRVSKAAKGIYIVDGKKVVIK